MVAADGAGLTRQLVGEKVDQTITLVAEELVASREVIKLKLIGKNLDRKDWCGFGSSDPFLTILRANEPGQWFVVHRTEVMKGDLSPDWLPLEMTVSRVAKCHRYVKRLVIIDVLSVKNMIFRNSDCECPLQRRSPQTAEAARGGLEHIRKSQYDWGGGDKPFCPS